MKTLRGTKVFYGENLKEYRDILIISGLFIVSLILFGLGLVLFEIHAVNFSDNIIIHFDFFQGITLIGGADKVYEVVSLAGLIQCLNMFFVWFFLKRQLFLAYLLASATLFFSGLIFIELLVIISVN
jgi:hypothetical protein